MPNSKGSECYFVWACERNDLIDAHITNEKVNKCTDVTLVKNN